MAFWTDLLASLANANTGGRFDVAKAAYGVTPEGRQRRQDQLGLEAAQTRMGVSAADTAVDENLPRRALSQQLNRYLQENDVAGLPFDAQRAGVRNANFAGDAAQQSIYQSQNRFQRELEDVDTLRYNREPVSEFGTNALAANRRGDLESLVARSGERLREKELDQMLLRMGIDAAQLGQFQFDAQGRPAMDMTEILGALYEKIGLPRPRSGEQTGVSDADRARAAAIHGGGGQPGGEAPPRQAPPPYIAPPIQTEAFAPGSGMFGPPADFVPPPKQPPPPFTPGRMIQPSAPDRSGMAGTPRMSKEELQMLKQRIEQALKKLPDQPQSPVPRF